VATEAAWLNGKQFGKRRNKALLTDIDLADTHGQYKFNFRHGAISREDSKRFLDWAFWRDFERNGPSLYRMCQTMFQGWQRYKNYPDPRVRERFAREVKKLIRAYSAALWVMEREFKKVNRIVSEQIHRLRHEVENEFPVVARLTAAWLGPILLVVPHAERSVSWLQGVRTNLQPLSSAAIGFPLLSLLPRGSL
jgi:hypothetical protein